MKVAYPIILIETALLAAYCGFRVATAPTLAHIHLAVLILLYLLILAVCWVLATVLHECGHLVLGNLCGFKVKLGKLNLLSGSSFCQLSPKHGGNMKMRLAITTAGGMFVNLLLVACGIVGLCVGGLELLGAWLPPSLYLLELNALPVMLKAGKTDGLVLHELLSDRPEAKVLLAVMEAQGRVNGGTPLKDLDEELLMNVPVVREDDYGFIMLTELRAKYFEARGEREQALKYNQRFEELKGYL
jgi:hypothetical protein